MLNGMTYGRYSQRALDGFRAYGESYRAGDNKRQADALFEVANELCPIDPCSNRWGYKAWIEQLVSLGLVTRSEAILLVAFYAQPYDA
jgi:hypothetical protein